MVYLLLLRHHFGDASAVCVNRLAISPRDSQESPRVPATADPNGSSAVPVRPAPACRNAALGGWPGPDGRDVVYQLRAAGQAVVAVPGNRCKAACRYVPLFFDRHTLTNRDVLTKIALRDC